MEPVTNELQPSNGGSTFTDVEYEVTKSDSISSRMFSMAFEPIKWFIGLRWYVIVLIVVFGSFIFMQLESAFETRRNAYKAKKEGLETANSEKMKGIMQQSDREYRQETFTPLRIKDAQSVAFSVEGGVLNEKRCKGVTFGPTTTHTFYSDTESRHSPTKLPSSVSLENPSIPMLILRSGIDQSPLSLSATFHKIYNWWIVPWFYVLFRSMGLR
jgi:hypothetical protein